jgi:cytochrome c oxidase subunit 4
MTATDVEHADSHEDGHAHPSDWDYARIALILGVLTAIEVFTYFESVHNLGANALRVTLVVLMVLKFVYVGAWFMHLKFDHPILRNIFTTGLVLALLVYLAMLTAFRVWPT